ncbi:hypothetical protein N9Y17_02740 [Gammaproteobacteria bacterium]|nr:hypothetical protein [Gammaproteobacteria bacterium]
MSWLASILHGKQDSANLTTHYLNGYALQKTLHHLRKGKSLYNQDQWHDVFDSRKLLPIKQSVINQLMMSYIQAINSENKILLTHDNRPNCEQYTDFLREASQTTRDIDSESKKQWKQISQTLQNSQDTIHDQETKVWHTLEKVTKQPIDTKLKSQIQQCVSKQEIVDYILMTNKTMGESLIKQYPQYESLIAIAYLINLEMIHVN